MATVMVADFAGMTPLRDAILLPDNNSQYAENTWLYEGKIRGFRHGVSIQIYGSPISSTLKYSDTKLVYRIPLNTVNPPDFSYAGSLWLEYPDPYMATLRNPTVGDEFNRYYFFPSDQINAVVNHHWRGGPQYATLAMLQAGTAPWVLGVPPQNQAPTVTPPATSALHNVVTVTGTTGDRAFVTTMPGERVVWLDSVANVLVGMLASDITDTSLTQVAVSLVVKLATTAAFVNTSPNITMVVNPGSILPGMNVYNYTANPTTPPLVGTVLTYNGTALVLTANALVGGAAGDTLEFKSTTIGAPAGTTILTFASVGTIGTANRIRVGMQCKNLTNPASIFSGAAVTAVDDVANTVTLNFVIVLNIMINDTIQFDNVFQIPANATVAAIDTTVRTVTLSADVVSAGIYVGDKIQFDTDVPETRAYTYTWVTAYNEEGPPSPVTTAVGDPTGTWTITVPALDPAIAANRNIQGFRLYRTVTDSQGNAAYYQVNPDIYFTPPNSANLAGHTCTDTSLPKDITANKSLDTVSYTPPPADLQGVVMMANGIAAGWSNSRELWFSAAYLPHAWPEVFALTVDYPIVGLTADGSSLNVITEGPPFIATGVTPDTMTLGKITASEPCTGRGSVIASGEGAFYASPNGYILLNSSGTINMTLNLFEKEFLYSLAPNNFAGARYGQSMVVFFKNNPVTPLPPASGTVNGAVIDFANKNVPFSYIDTMTPLINVYNDELSGQVFYVTNTNVVQWNPPIGSPGSTSLWGYVWRTKKFRFTFPQQLAAFMVLFSVPPEVTFTLGVRNTDQGQTYNPATQYLIVRVFADGNQIVVREVQTSGETLLIPGGFKATLWEFQLEGIVEVRFFKAASSVKELKAA